MTKFIPGKLYQNKIKQFTTSTGYINHLPKIWSKRSETLGDKWYFEYETTEEFWAKTYSVEWKTKNNKNNVSFLYEYTVYLHHRVMLFLQEIHANDIGKKDLHKMETLILHQFLYGEKYVYLHMSDNLAKSFFEEVQ